MLTVFKCDSFMTCQPSDPPLSFVALKAVGAQFLPLDT